MRPGRNTWTQLPALQFTLLCGYTPFWGEGKM